MKWHLFLLSTLVLSIVIEIECYNHLSGSGSPSDMYPLYQGPTRRCDKVCSARRRSHCACYGCCVGVTRLDWGGWCTPEGTCHCVGYTRQEPLMERPMSGDSGSENMYGGYSGYSGGG